jgi:hypothetical protein
VRTREGVLLVVFVVLVVATTGLALGAVYAHGVWRDLSLNLLAEAVGAAFIVLFVDQLFERSKQQDRDGRRRAAIEDLRLVLGELHTWLGRLFARSEPAVTHYQTADDPDRVSLEALLQSLPRALGTIDFAASGPYKRDRYLIEWARRSFDETALELARWERNFAGSAELFDEHFRDRAELLRSFVRATGSFLEGMELYILRETPRAPVLAYEGITELTEENARRLAAELRSFLDFYRDECERYDATIPDFGMIFESAVPRTDERAGVS